MKKIHHKSLKFHTLYSIALSIILLAVIVMVRDITLGITMFLLLAYIVGNGIIHSKKNELQRDTILEYIIVSVIVLIVIIGALR